MQTVFDWMCQMAASIFASECICPAEWAMQRQHNCVTSVWIWSAIEWRERYCCSSVFATICLCVITDEVGRWETVSRISVHNVHSEKEERSELCQLGQTRFVCLHVCWGNLVYLLARIFVNFHSFHSWPRVFTHFAVTKKCIVFSFTGPSTPVSKQPKTSDSSNGGFATPKKPAPSKEGSTSKQNLHKTFLSKSQDNLASQLRRKAVAAALSQKGKEKENPGNSNSQNKENKANNSWRKIILNHRKRREKKCTFLCCPLRGMQWSLDGRGDSSCSHCLMSWLSIVPSTLLLLLAGPKEKAVASPAPKGKHSKSSTTAHLQKVAPGTQDQDTPIKRAQSAQNVSKPQPSKVDNKTSTNVKRASSTQNISGKNGGGRQVRIAAPSVNIMAYNAELLASFEKEKKAYERRISELIQVAENRKTEIEKYKFEVKNLKEQISNEPNMQEKMEMIQHENQVLKEKLKEMGVSVEEQITDSEKLSMLHRGTAQRLSDGQESRGATGGSSLIPQTSKRKKEKIPDFNSHGDPILTSGGNLGSIDAELGLSVGDLSCITPEHPSSLDNR